MPQSVYDNGGMVGVTLDFGDTDSYVITPGVPANLTYVTGAIYRTSGRTSDWNVIGLNDIGVQVGDLVIVFFATNPDDTGEISYRISGEKSGLYTEVANVYTLDTQRVQLQVGYRVAATDDDDIIILGGTADIDQAGQAVVQVWRGADLTTPLDVTVQTSSSANTVIPDPPSITPTTDGAVIVVAGAGGHTSGTGAYTAPYLTNFLEQTSNDTHDVTLGVGWTSWSGGSFDPPEFGTNMENNTAFAAAAVTLALRPAFTPAVLGNQKNSGIWSLSSVLESITPVVSGNTRLNYISHLKENSSSTSYAFSTNYGVFFGTRLAVVVVHNETSGTTPSSPTQVTIDGIAATKAVEANTSGSTSSHASIWYAEVSYGTKTVGVQYSLAPLRMSIGSYAIQGYSSTTPIFTGFSESPAIIGSRTIETSILGSGVSVISAQTSGDRYEHTWSGLNENYDEQLIGLTGGTSASLVTASQGVVTATVTPTSTPTQTTSMVLAVWA